MKKGLTNLIFIVDRSGSMGKIASDMIGGYNEFIKKQAELPSDCFVSFYQFDDKYDAVFERKALKDVPALDNTTYVPRGFTALYDAVGKTINDYGKYLSDLKEEERPERVLVVIITDGLNNASHEFDMKEVRDMVKHQTEKYLWDFVFLGSNIDAWSHGESMGIASASTLQFANSKGSVQNAFKSLSRNVRSYRSCDTKAAYSFDSQDLKDQDEFLVGDLKSKNKEKQKTETTKK